MTFERRRVKFRGWGLNSGALCIRREWRRITGFPGFTELWLAGMAGSFATRIALQILYRCLDCWAVRRWCPTSWRSQKSVVTHDYAQHDKCDSHDLKAGFR